MRFDIVLTLFPGMFPGYLGQSLLDKAIQRGLVSGQRPRHYATGRDNKHHNVDDRPFGGGPGMVLCVEPVVECVEAVQKQIGEPATTILLTPKGRRFNQQVVEEYSTHQHFILLCGRYEGFDQRVIDILQPHQISLGDFILNGGEVAAMAFIDATIRLVPEVLGDEQSSVDDSFSSGNRHLEHPQYTRPREYRGHAVPDILLGGNHEEIARWRKEESLKRTKEQRNDLL